MIPSAGSARRPGRVTSATGRCGSLCAEAFARGHLVQFVTGLLTVAVVAAAVFLAAWAALGHWRSALAVLLILGAAALFAGIRDFFTKR